MGIFSRIFQRGQDGNPADAAEGVEDGTAMGDAMADENIEEAEISLTSSMIVASAPVAPAPAPSPPPLPGLTPAFATSSGAPLSHTPSAPSAPSESARSMWEWPGAQREPRRASPSSAASAPSSVSEEPPAPAAPPEPRSPSRAGALPSVPRTQAASEPPARPQDTGKERNPTMVLSPPPAPVESPRASRSSPPPPLPGVAKAAPPAASPPPARPAAPRAGAGAPPAPPPSSAPAPPTPASAAAPVPPTPASAAPQAGHADRPARRPHSDSVTAAFDLAIEASDAAASAPIHGVSTAEDLAEVRRVFNEVAVIHVAQVRDVMLELRYGDAQPSWIESTQPALRSLRTMAAQMELTDLCQALDEFGVAVDAAVVGRARIGEDGKAELLRRYQQLIDLIPQAFELDAERDRREPIIVEALLYQIDGVERRTVEKLFSVGLSRLDALLQATADEISVVAGIRQELADAIVEQFRTYKLGASAALSAPDPLAERRQLGDLLIMMSVQNDEYNHAATKWTDDARARKRDARRQRDQTFQRIKVALARLGEREQLARLEKLPFDERIGALDRYLSAAVPARPQPGKS